MWMVRLSWQAARLAWRAMTGKKRGKSAVKRLIIVGLDGQEPKLTDRFMAEGKLPNFQPTIDSLAAFR